MVKEDQQQIVKRLKAGDEKALREVYVEHKSLFINFLRRYNLNDEDLNDIYQDAVIALFENAKKGKIDNLQSTISTYLIGIGKYMAMHNNRTKQRTIVDNEVASREVDKQWEETAATFESTASAQQQLMLTEFERLGKTCKQILTLFYYEGYTIQEIMSIMGYDTENVCKATKSRCLKTLRNYVKEN